MAWTTPATAVADDVLTAAFWNAQVRDNWNAAFPVGSLHYRMQSATTVETLVDGFGLETNGVNVNRTTYSALQTKMSALGFPFGTGDGSTTMGIPDLQGRALYAMASGGHSDVNGLGDSDGYTKTTRTPKHNSSDSLGISGSPGGGPFGVSLSKTTQFPAGGSGAAVLDVSLNTGAVTAGSLAVSGSVGPGGTRPDDVVPYQVCGIWIVKT